MQPSSHHHCSMAHIRTAPPPEDVDVPFHRTPWEAYRDVDRSLLHCHEGPKTDQEGKKRRGGGLTQQSTAR